MRRFRRTKRPRRGVGGIRNALVCVAVFSLVSVAAAQDVDGTGFVTEEGGTVRAMERHGNDLFIGGEFHYVGPNTGGGAELTTTGTTANANFPHVNGTVYVCHPDGDGGWYIGGDFDSVGGEDLQNLAHIDATGAVTSDWDPNPDGPVYALASLPAVLWIGGDFDNISGSSRSNFAEMVNNPDYESLATYAPNPNGPVHAIAVRANWEMYIGGQFTTIGGVARTNVAQIDLVTSGTPVEADWTANTNGRVRAIHYSAKNTSDIYIGGDFTTVDGSNRDYLARISVDGDVKSWTANTDGSVYAIDVDATNENVFIGGFFSQVKASTRRGLAKLSENSNSQLKAWHPNVKIGSNEGWVRTLVVSGTSVFFGGEFDSVRGEDRDDIAEVGISSATHSPTTWEPIVTSTVHAMCVNGTDLYVGGEFNSIGGARRNHLAKINLVAGTLDAWDPDMDDAVHAMDERDDILYVGGAFEDVGGTTRDSACAFDLDTAGDPLTSWDPDVSGGIVYVIRNEGTDSIYVGGNFSSVDGSTRNAVARIEDDGDVDATWNPNCNGPVYAILEATGSGVYLGGEFSTIGGTGRGGIGRVNTTTGAVDAWDPDPNANFDPQIYSIVTPDSFSTVLIGGNFTGFPTSGGTEQRLNIARLSTSTGDPTSWEAGDSTSVHGASDTVFAIAVVASLDRIYVGGRFNVIGDDSRARVALLDLDTGDPEDWTPEVSDPPPTTFADVLTILADSSWSEVFVGGRFNSVDDQLRANVFAADDDPVE